jgi:hypothetical protein
MKFYFETLNPNESNANHLSVDDDGNTFWLVSNGTIIKKFLGEIGQPIDSLDNLTDPGVYYFDVNGDPPWWAAQLNNPHVIYGIHESIVELIRNKKLRMVIGADREGGGMTGVFGDGRLFDCFQTTTQAMLDRNMPAGSVLITSGNRKVERQYQDWLSLNEQPKMFDIMYANHFGKIFFDDKLPAHPLILESINNDSAVDFNSLNRIYRTHRGAHVFQLATDNVLDKGIVSCNCVDFNDKVGPTFAETTYDQFFATMTQHFPKFVDGNWSTDNAANQYNVDVYKNSLMTFITETKFDEDVVFLTEKVFKPMALGHPLILLSTPGTLSALRDLGFRTNWCGIDPAYNDIEDHTERFKATHKVLMDWIALPRAEKIQQIQYSMVTINHNFKLIRQKDFYRDAIIEIAYRCRKYLNA